MISNAKRFDDQHTAQSTSVAIKNDQKTMNFQIGLAILVVSSLVGCSSGGGGSADGSSNDGSQGQVLVPDLTGAPLVDSYPTNEELTATGGVPDIDQARDLIEGSWASTDDATQCVTAYQFGQFGVFATSSLDQRASGEYRLDREGQDNELSLDYSSENFQTACQGFIEESDILDTGLSIIWDVRFPDRNTMIFEVLGREVFTFARQ